MSFIIAQVLGFVGTILSLGVVQLKKIGHILIGELLCNVMIALNYLLLGGYSGAVICAVSIAQILMSYHFAKKNKPFKWQYACLFIVIYGISTALSYQTAIDILPFAGAAFAVLAIMQKKPAMYRAIMLLNSLVLIPYDFSTKAYTTLLTHGMLLISITIAMIRLDRKNNKKGVMAMP